MITLEVRGRAVVQWVQKRNTPVMKEFYPYLNELAKDNQWVFRKVSGNGNETALTRMVFPAFSTYLAFNWQVVLKWFQIDSSLEFLQDSAFKGVITLGLGLHAFMKWIDYMASTGRGVTKEVSSL